MIDVSLAVSFFYFFPLFCFNIEDDEARPIDWSCMDVFVVGNRNGLTIYDNNGTVYDMLRPWDAPTAVKWSNDGKRIQSEKKNCNAEKSNLGVQFIYIYI